MLTFKFIRFELNKRNIRYFESENGQHIIIPACYFSDDNFFDYGEPYKPPKCKSDKFLLQLYNDPRIIIETCNICCGCAGW